MNSTSNNMSADNNNRLGLLSSDDEVGRPTDNTGPRPEVPPADDPAVLDVPSEEDDKRSRSSAYCSP